MLVREHHFRLHIGGKIHSILVEEYVSHGKQWPQEFRANVPISTFESKAFYASTSEGAAEKAARYLIRSNVHSIDRASLQQIQLRQETGTHDD
jgi:hypothetical protein